MKKTGKRIISGALLIIILIQAFSILSFAGDNYLYQNGSTNEYVYSTVAACNSQGGGYIGYLYPYSKARVCGYYAGCYIILYQAGEDNKVGFVKYNGGNSDPYWHPQPFKNGSSNTPVYASTGDARNKANSIGYIYPYTECTLVYMTDDKYGNLYPVVLYSTGNTAKVGLVNIPY